MYIVGKEFNTSPASTVHTFANIFPIIDLQLSFLPDKCAAWVYSIPILPLHQEEKRALAALWLFSLLGRQGGCRYPYNKISINKKNPTPLPRLHMHAKCCGIFSFS